MKNITILASILALILGAPLVALAIQGQANVSIYPVSDNYSCEEVCYDTLVMDSFPQVHSLTGHLTNTTSSGSSLGSVSDFTIKVNDEVIYYDKKPAPKGTQYRGMGFEVAWMVPGPGVYVVSASVKSGRLVTVTERTVTVVAE